MRWTASLWKNLATLWLVERLNMNLFKRSDKLGTMYACHTGPYAGRFFIFIKKNEGKYGFLMCPEMTNEWIDKEEVDFGIENKIIEYVKRVPRFVRRTVEKKFEENSKEGVQPSDGLCDS